MVDVIAFDGDDTLWGGGFESPSYLNGGAGNDQLRALGEVGRMSGRAGDDIFYFFGSNVHDAHIEDFTKGEDKIELSGLGAYDADFNRIPVDAARLNAMLSGSTGNVLDLRLLGDEFAGLATITLNVQVSTLDQSDFIL